MMVLLELQAWAKKTYWWDGLIKPPVIGRWHPKLEQRKRFLFWSWGHDYPIGSLSIGKRY